MSTALTLASTIVYGSLPCASPGIGIARTLHVDPWAFILSAATQNHADCEAPSRHVMQCRPVRYLLLRFRCAPNCTDCSSHLHALLGHFTSQLCAARQCTHRSALFGLAGFQTTCLAHITKRAWLRCCIPTRYRVWLLEPCICDAIALVLFLNGLVRT